MVLYDSQRVVVRLGPVMARGGEGVVYQAEGRDGMLAKVYTPPKPDYEAKLRWMLRNPPATPPGHAAIAWPGDLLYDKHGTFLGFLMPQVRGAAPLFDVFNPRRRGQTLPGFNTRYLHRTARNLAAAVSALHARDYVIGDLNESNVLVTPTALVTLIDTDSFQVKEHRASQIVFYPCPVGKPEYTPPELQGKTFNREVRTADQDRFGLAVLIFQMLMEGSHPFRSLWRGEGDPPAIAEKIARGWYPYALSPRGPIAPPTLAPPLDVLHPTLVELLARCFDAGHLDPRRRPTALDWEQALGEAESALVTCRNGHIYAGHLKKCPRCQAQAARPAQTTAAASRATPPAPPKAKPAPQAQTPPPPRPRPRSWTTVPPPPPPKTQRGARTTTSGRPSASTWTMPPLSPFSGVRRQIFLEWAKALFMAWATSRLQGPTRGATVSAPRSAPPVTVTPRRGFAEMAQRAIVVTAITVGVWAAATSGDVGGWVAARQIPPPSAVQSVGIPLVTTVDARQGWQATGLSVNQGDKIALDVLGGAWATQRGQALVGAGGAGSACGQTRAADLCSEPLPGAPTGSLLARVGDQVLPAPAGTIIAPASGPLLLRINDGDAVLADNEGELRVRLTVTR